MTTETDTTPAAAGDGEFELVAKIFDQQTSKVGEPFTFQRYRQGDLVQLNASEAARLLAAGAVVKPGSRQAAAAAAARLHFEALLAQVPEDLRAQVLEGLDGGGSTAEQSTPPSDPSTEDEAPQSPTPVVPATPRKTAPKEDWVAYAVSRGAEQAEAEKLERPELIARYGS